jgi:hypothetical protein
MPLPPATNSSELREGAIALAQACQDVDEEDRSNVPARDVRRRMLKLVSTHDVKSANMMSW